MQGARWGAKLLLRCVQLTESGIFYPIQLISDYQCRIKCSGQIQRNCFHFAPSYISFHLGQPNLTPSTQEETRGGRTWSVWTLEFSLFLFSRPSTPPPSPQVPLFSSTSIKFWCCEAPPPSAPPCYFK